eukprot:CAMPEP_0116891172 /NCGR_PEP_ID=MMETSP0467-20121206/1634_1 /TAXON_ID=283647 /ORGANISM="Mesodinium pulex, Strain SPMC105" /LENGTH=75 /DNA_ID=CAMNT_0004559513 /DNA_START=647 /DNA_END=874 /DNA_ORIENTATION=+
MDDPDRIYIKNVTNDLEYCNHMKVNLACATQQSYEEKMNVPYNEELEAFRDPKPGLHSLFSGYYIDQMKFNVRKL